eukprot:jgi/Mesvir1/8683/Mv02621-RA.1
MAQAASDKRARDRHRCVLPAALPARDAQRQSWLAQVAPLPRLRDVRARVMAACQALPKGAGGKRRQPGAITQYPGFSAEAQSELLHPPVLRRLVCLRRSVQAAGAKGGPTPGARSSVCCLSCAAMAEVVEVV